MAFRLARHACAVALALSIPAAFGQGFSQLYFFGDSLTDGGAFAGLSTSNTANGAPTTLPANARWVLDNAKNWADYVAAQYGLSSVPVNVANANTNQKGNNYAQGGARSVTSGSHNADDLSVAVRDLDTQVTDYLTRTGGKADPNAVYFLWTGGNDVVKAATDAALAQATGSTATQAATIATNDITAAATSVLTQVGTLQHVGAKTIVLPNLPNFANTPAALYSTIQAVAQATGTTANLSKAIGAAWVALSSGSNNSTATEQATITAAVNAAATQLGVPSSALQSAYTQNVQSLTQLVSGFTQAVNFGLGTSVSSQNVIRPDIAGLFNEFLQAPAQYGFTNVTGGACAPSAAGFTDSSLTCTSPTPFKQTYLFSDDRHPSPEAQKAIAQYELSLLNGPAYAAALPEGSFTAGRQLDDALDGRLQVLRSQSRAVGTVGAFANGGYRGDDVNTNTTAGSFSGDNRASQLTLGFDVQQSENLSWGMAVSGGKNRVGLGSQGDYDNNSLLFSSQITYQRDKLWVSGDAHIGRSTIDSNRQVQLGAATRTMNGETNAFQYGLRVNGGYQLQYGNITTGPRLGLATEYVKVAALREDGQQSTSMRFGDQRVTSTTGRIGWDIGTTISRFSPFANVSLVHEFEKGDRSVSAGLVTQPGSWEYQVEGGKRNWAEYQLGVSAKLNDQFSGVLSVAATSGRDSGNQKAINLGVSASF